MWYSKWCELSKEYLLLLSSGAFYPVERDNRFLRNIYVKEISGVSGNFGRM